MKGRVVRNLLVAASLMFAQQGELLHALSHAGHDLAVAEHGKKNAPPLDHRVEVCVAFHAVGSALLDAGHSIDLPRIAPVSVALLGLPFLASPRIEFDSRAPPLFS